MPGTYLDFAATRWAIIAAAVVVSATAMAIVDFHDDEEFPYEHKSILARAGKALYLGFGSLMSGGSMFSASSMSAKIVTLGFQLFLVITMASYTANLASILVVANVKSGVNGIDDAIDMGLVVCVPAAVERTVVLNYPSLKTYIFGGSTTDFARLMHAGLCDATIIHQKRIDQLHSGEIHDIDCKAVADGDLTEEEGMCVNGKGGAPRDDCSMLRVGDSIFNVPVAFPIRPGDTNLLTALSWALTDAQRSGEWEAATVSNAALFPQSRCSSAAVSSAQLGWDAFAGASFFALAAAVLAVTLHFSKRHAWNRAPVKGDSDGTADGTHVLREESDESAVNVKSAGAGLAGSDTGRAELAFHSEGGLGEVGVQQGRGVAVPVGQSADATSPQTQQQLDRILLQLDRLEKSVQQSNTARRPEPARPPPVAPSKERRGPSSGLRLEPTAPTPSDDDGQQHCDGGRRASGGSAQPRERTGSMPWDDWGLPWGDAASKN